MKKPKQIPVVCDEVRCQVTIYTDRISLKASKHWNSQQQSAAFWWESVSCWRLSYKIQDVSWWSQPGGAMLFVERHQ